MANMFEAVRYMEDYLNKVSAEVSKDIKIIDTTKKNDPVSSSSNEIKQTVAEKALSDLSNNAIIAAGEAVNKIATKTVQDTVGAALKKINLSPVQNAVQNFFQIWASVSTAQAEIAMELARNTARNISTTLDRKDAIIMELKTELTALHNACIIILNCFKPKFLQDYIQQLQQALILLKSAEYEFDQVLKRLNSPQRQTFLKTRFNDGISDLEQAQKLILPPSDASIESIRDGSFFSDVIDVQSTSNAIAAAIAIPGITLKIGKLFIDYTKTVTELNLLINTYYDALDGFISSFVQNRNINNVIYDHVENGNNQLKTLIKDVDATINPNLSVTPDFNPALKNYNPRLVAAATNWGVRLQSIIEWMKLNPGLGTTLDQTSNSVDAYNSSLEGLKNNNNISYVGGTYFCTQSRESGDQFLKDFTKLLLTVNTIVATTKTSSQISLEFKKITGYLDASLQNSNRIRSDLAIFRSTQTTLPSGARTALNSALDVANKYGLDRVVGLISDGKVRELFNVTPDTATYAGSAVVGMNIVLSAIKSDPTSTDAQIQKIEGLRDEYSREQKNQELEANRSYAFSLDAVQEAFTNKLSSIEKTIKPAIEAAKQLDKQTQSNDDKAEQAVSDAVPGFTDNRRLADI